MILDVYAACCSGHTVSSGSELRVVHLSNLVSNADNIVVPKVVVQRDLAQTACIICVSNDSHAIIVSQRARHLSLVALAADLNLYSNYDSSRTEAVA